MIKLPDVSDKENVGQKERLASMLSGSAMLAYAVLRPSRASIPIAASGGYLLYRGATGQCKVYATLGIDRSLMGHKGIEVERTLTVNKPRNQVYHYWRQFENLPSFMKYLESVQVIDLKRSHWITRAPLGRHIEWDAEIVDEKENERIAWRTLPGSEIDHSGIIVFKDAPQGRGTEIHVDLKYAPPGGSVTDALVHLFGEAPEQQVLEDLRRFKQVVESGLVATVFGQTSGRVDETQKERYELERRRRKDVVQEASEESFPASDAPAWTGGSEKSL